MNTRRDTLPGARRGPFGRFGWWCAALLAAGCASESYNTVETQSVAAHRTPYSGPVYTIAIGEADDTNPSLLSAVATHPTLYYYEPDPEDLARVYSEIVGTFGCPKSRLEWEGSWPEEP